MSWLSSFVKNPGAAIGNLGNNAKREVSNNRENLNYLVNPIGAATKQPMLDPMGQMRQNMVGNALDGAGMAAPLGDMSGLGGSAASSRDADMLAGRKRGAEVFDAPDMLSRQARKDDLSKGYTGQELGALKGQAMSDIQGQRAGFTQQLMGNLARQGVGGARAAAVRGSADQGYNKNLTDFQRKLTADNAGLVRQGEQEATDFAMKRKYGGLSTELGYAQLGVNERTAANAAAATKEKPGFNLFNPTSWFA